MAAPVSIAYPWFLRALSEHKGTDCLLWPFHVDKNGYGKIRFDGKKIRVHQLAFFVTQGHWPSPCTCHTCDNPRCFNPAHLFEGSHAVNQADAVSKGRKAAGERNGAAKLSAELVRQIRAEHVEGDAYVLSRRYGVSAQQIYRVLKRDNWKSA